MKIALTCFNRLGLLKKTMKSLHNCKDSEKYPIYYFQDRDDSAGFLEVNDYIKKNKREMDKIFISDKRLGLRANTLTAIYTTLKDDNEIIWLQDDMEFSKDFLQFMNFAFDEFRNNGEIMFISGYSQILHHSLYLSPCTNEAMGIWKHKFVFYDKPGNDLQEYRNFAGDMYYNYLLDVDQKDMVAVLFNYSMFRSHAYCLHPNRNKLRHLLTNSTNCRLKEIKLLNQSLLEGYSTRIDSGNTNLVQRYTASKNIRRWLARRILNYI